MVTDLSINVAQNMLHEQYRLCGGIQDRDRGPFRQFAVC